MHNWVREETILNGENKMTRLRVLFLGLCFMFFQPLSVVGQFALPEKGMKIEDLLPENGGLLIKTRHDLGRLHQGSFRSWTLRMTAIKAYYQDKPKIQVEGLRIDYFYRQNAFHVLSIYTSWLLQLDEIETLMNITDQLISAQTEWVSNPKANSLEISFTSRDGFQIGIYIETPKKKKKKNLRKKKRPSQPDFYLSSEEISGMIHFKLSTLKKFRAKLEEAFQYFTQNTSP